MMSSVPVPNHLVRRLWISVIGALIFMSVSTVHGMLVPGFDLSHQSVSALALAPYGWIQTANFALLGGAVLATVPAWRSVLSGDIGGTSYPVLTTTLGVSLVAAGCVPQDPAPGYDPAGLTLQAPTVTGLFHLAIAGVAAFCSVALMFILASRLSNDPAWKGWPGYTRGMATLTIVCIAVYGFWSTHPDGYAGIFERAAVILPAVWGATFLRRLGQGTAVPTKTA